MDGFRELGIDCAAVRGANLIPQIAKTVPGSRAIATPGAFGCSCLGEGRVDVEPIGKPYRRAGAGVGHPMATKSRAQVVLQILVRAAFNYTTSDPWINQPLERRGPLLRRSPRRQRRPGKGREPSSDASVDRSH